MPLPDRYPDPPAFAPSPRANKLKADCPACGKRRRFAPYCLDGGRGEPVDVQAYGKCDREGSCGYNEYPPGALWKVGAGGGGVDQVTARPEPKPDPPLATLDPALLDGGGARVLDCNLARFLVTLFPVDDVAAVLALYRCRSSSRWPGAIAFPQIDVHGRLRQVKVMPYGLDGRRVKGARFGARFAGRTLAERTGVDGELVQCFFGEHLLRERPDDPVAIVESEKTALVCELAARVGLAPRAVYLATGGKDGCRWADVATFSVLRGRRVKLYADDDASGRGWDDKLPKVAHLAAAAKVSHLVAELDYPGKVLDAGHDLADVLLGLRAAGAVPASEAPAPVLAEAPAAATPAPVTPTVAPHPPPSEPDPAPRPPLDILLDAATVDALAQRAERIDAEGDSEGSAAVLERLRRRYPGPSTEDLIDRAFAGF